MSSSSHLLYLALMVCSVDLQTCRSSLHFTTHAKNMGKDVILARKLTLSREPLSICWACRCKVWTSFRGCGGIWSAPGPKSRLFSRHRAVWKCVALFSIMHALIVLHVYVVESGRTSA